MTLQTQALRDILVALTNAVQSLQECAAEIAASTDGLSSAFEKQDGSLRLMAVIEQNTERHAIEIDKLRTVVGALSDRLGSLETLSRDRHSEVMAALASIGARTKTADQLMAEQGR